MPKPLKVALIVLAIIFGLALAASTVFNFSQNVYLSAELKRVEAEKKASEEKIATDLSTIATTANSARDDLDTVRKSVIDISDTLSKRGIKTTNDVTKQLNKLGFGKGGK